MIFDVYLGDSEWEKIHGEHHVGTVEAENEEEARSKLAEGKWLSIKSHDTSPGYWLVARR